MKKIIFTITLHLILAGITFAQVADLSFENWYTDSLGHNVLTNWTHYAGSGPSPNNSFFGTWRSDTAAQGAHALKLSRWYNYTCDWAQQVAPVSNRPWGVSGYYKYEENILIQNNIDSALVEMVLTKWNTTTMQRDTIGFGSKLLLGSVGFSIFNCPVTYIAAGIPDTVTINIRPMPWSSSYINMAGWGSYLTIDDLSFAERSTSGIKLVTEDGLFIYPNPVKDKLHIHMAGETSFAITDITGKRLLQSKLGKGDNSIDVSRFAAGSYLLILNDKEYSKTSTKFVKE